jgi:molybdopterin biosynthesis enzyme
MVAMFMLVRPAIEKLGRLPVSRDGRLTATLTQDVRKPPGIRKVIKVRVNDGKATPVKLIAESGAPGEYGYLVIPEDAGGYQAGDAVECIFLE